MRSDTSSSQTRRRAPDPVSLIAASAGWLALMFGPWALGGPLDPVTAQAVACAAIALWLTATRRSRPAPAAHAIALFALAALAGYAAAPAWIAGIGWAGLGLGLPPPAPARAGAAPLVWLAAAALGPLAEELVYRERLLHALRPAGAAVAIGVTSLLFALSHRGAFPMLAAGCLGIALGAAMWRAGSLALCAGYHAGLNSAALAGGVPPAGRVLEPAASAAVGTALAAAAIGLAGRLRALPRCAAVALVVPALAGAKVLPFDATLRLEPLPSSFPPLEIHGAGVATVNGSADGIALETIAFDGLIDGTASVPITDPSVGGVTTFELAAVLGGQSLRPFHPPAPPGSPQLDATLAARGEIRFCFMWLGCNSSVLALPLDDTSWSGAAVGVGVGGIIGNGLNAIRMSLYAAPWTVRTATLTLETPSGGSFALLSSGFAHGPASFTGSTALTGGELELVTPIRVKSLGAGPSLPMWGRLSLHFVPEPAPALLLSAGGLAIALAARRRGTPGGRR